MSFDLPDGWKIVKLGDVCENVSSTHRNIKTKMILINTSDILEGKVLNHIYSNTQGMAGQFKKAVQYNDILYSEIRPKNKRYAFIDFCCDDYICSTKLMVIRGKNSIDIKFLYLYLTSDNTLTILQKQAEERSGTFPQITFSNVSNLEIPLPPLYEQKAIAETLSSLSGKIELNNRINKILEETAQTIFKRWFVDFEFPNEDGQPYKSNGGAMVDSELGEIPQGWRVGTLGEIVEVKDGTHDSPKANSFGYKLVTTKHLKDYSIDFDGAYYISEDDFNAINKRSKVDTYDILISMIGTVGIVTYVLYDNINFAIKNIGLFKTSKTRELAEFILLFLKSEVAINYLSNRLTGSTQKYISLSELRNFTVTVPDCVTLEKFKILIQPFFDIIKIICLQTQTLTAIRDALLPKLMSGEIRVPITEQN